MLKIAFRKDIKITTKKNKQLRKNLEKNDLKTSKLRSIFCIINQKKSVKSKRSIDNSQKKYCE